MSIRLVFPFFSATGLLLGALLFCAPVSAQDICVTSRKSLDQSADDPNNHSRLPSITSNARFIVFESDASDLVFGDTNNLPDVFVVDVLTGETELISRSSTGGATDGASDHASISDDGRWVVFESVATNLVGSDTNGVRDVFMYDRELDQMKRISMANTGAEGNGPSGQGGLRRGSAIAGGGYRVVFQSHASNLVSGDTNLVSDIFAYDRLSSSVSLVSQSIIGPAVVPANGSSQDPHISGNNGYVAFTSYANNLVGGDTNGETDIFVVEFSTLIAVRASVANDGTESDGSSWQPKLSHDGMKVAFESHATTLVPGDGNGVIDVFLFDRQAYSIERVSVGWQGQEANNYCYRCSISPDGNRIGFTSAASNLVPNGNGIQNVYVRDLAGATTERWGEDSAGGTGFAGTDESSLDYDGSRMAMMSLSALVPTDTNGMKDIYLRYCGPTATTYCRGYSEICPCSNGGVGDAGCENSYSTGGGLLTATGLPSVTLDSVTVTATGLPTTATILFFQANNALGGGAGVQFGDGLRCAGGGLLRLKVKIASAGTSSYGYGVGSDIPISIRGLIPAAGATYRYQGWYRDTANYCTSDQFNLTNGLRIDWAP